MTTHAQETTQESNEHLLDRLLGYMLAPGSVISSRDLERTRSEVLNRMTGAPQAGGFSGVAAAPGEGARAREARNGWGWIMVDGVPRRSRVDHWTPAERAIADAVDVVERAGCDVRLTTAVTLLGKARDAVADFVDGCDTEAAQARALAATQPAPAPSSPRAEAPEAEREDAAALEPTGGFACPYCGQETPHHHAPGDVEELRRYGVERKRFEAAMPELFASRDPLRVHGYGAPHIWARRVTSDRPRIAEYADPKVDALWRVWLLAALRATPAPTGERAGGARVTVTLEEAEHSVRWLWRNGRHVAGCSSWPRRDDDDAPCDCGFAATFRAVKHMATAVSDALTRPAPVAAPRGTEGRHDAK